MIKLDTLGHICIIVDEIESATEFYIQLFNVAPLQDFPHFKNPGFAKAAGFLDIPDEVDVSIRFLKVPTEEGLILELMEYHFPKEKVIHPEKTVTDLNCVAHIALRVMNIEEAFNHVKSIDGVRLVNTSEEYVPHRLDSIKGDCFRFFDANLENNESEKSRVCEIIGNIRYFYFVDKYGIQWELEQGHSDIGSRIDR